MGLSTSAIHMCSAKDLKGELNAVYSLFSEEQTNLAVNRNWHCFSKLPACLQYSVCPSV